MRSVDTNVLARLVLQDDPAQFDMAQRLLHQPVWIAPTVWLELGWVLGSRLRMDRRTIADALQSLLSLDTVQTSDRAGLLWAIERFRHGADWADMIHILCSRENASTFATFDQAIAKAAGSHPPLPVETPA